MTKEQLKLIMPKCDIDKWFEPLSKSMDQFLINTNRRIAGFLANIAVESSECRILEENLKYSAARLHEVWPKRFPDIKSAELYANNPKALANKIYSGRMGNGDEASGDGWNFKGRGLIQLTGKSNYKRIGDVLQLDFISNPDSLLTPSIAALSAAAFFAKANCLAKCDSQDLEGLRKSINGGTLGFTEMKSYYRRIEKILE